MTVIPVKDSYERMLKVVNLNVFYKSGEQLYRLRENRFTINPGENADAVLEQVLQGDMSGVRPSERRPDRNSLSERIKLTVRL